MTNPNQTLAGTVYTGTPVKNLITAVPTTTAKTQADLEAAANFIAITTSPCARQKELVKKTYAGVYIFTRPNHVKPIYVLTTSNLSTASGTIVKQFVAQGVNDSSRIQPESVPLDISSNVVILIKHPPTAIPDIWAANVGTPFKKADVETVAPPLHNLIPEDDQDYCLVILCKCLVIRFGLNSVHRGPIDEVCSDMMEQNMPGSFFWAECMTQFSQPLHDAVISIHANNDKTLGTKLPKVNKKFAEFFAPTGFATTETLYTDDEELTPALDTLKKRLFDIVPTPPTIVEPHTSHSGSGGAGGSLGTKDTLMSTKIPRKPTIAKFTRDEQDKMKFCLANVGYDVATGQIVIPELTDDMHQLFDSISGARERNAFFDNILTSYEAGGDDDMDFLRRLAELPDLSNPVKAFYYSAYRPTKTITSFEGPKDKFRTYMVAPDSNATRQAREETKDERSIQELCGEEGKNLAKVNTEIIFNHSFLSFYPFLSFLANRNSLVEATVIVDRETWDDPANPLLFRFIRAVAITLTTSKSRAFFKTCPAAQKTKFFGWLVQMTDSYECHLNQIPNNTRNVLLALSEDYSKIDTSALQQAEDLKVDVLSKILKIISNTESIPHCALNASLEEKANKKRTADIDTATKVTPEQKKQKLKPAGDAEPADKSGPLVFSKGSHMPTVTEPDFTKRLCTPHIRKGLFCRKLAQNRCNLIHEKDPVKWNPDTLKAWWDHVEATPDLEWDSSIDTKFLKNKVDAYTKPAASK
eukprot:scaffold21809_cov24-Cyclotella_meneghiniana.AAC.2